MTTPAAATAMMQLQECNTLIPSSCHTKYSGHSNYAHSGLQWNETVIPKSDVSQKFQIYTGRDLPPMKAICSDSYGSPLSLRPLGVSNRDLELVNDCYLQWAVQRHAIRKASRQPVVIADELAFSSTHFRNLASSSLHASSSKGLAATQLRRATASVPQATPCCFLDFSA
jgi:hypothetical protein